MSEELPRSPSETELRIQRDAGLVNLPNARFRPMAEIINRSLVHIQTSKAQSALHRIGEHDLYGPDYRLVCEFSEDARLPVEEVIRRLLLSGGGHWETRIEDGRFKALRIDNETLPISFIPSIDGLVIERLTVPFQGNLSGFDFSIFSNLTDLCFHRNRLTDLDLFGVPKLKVLAFFENQLTKLNLSHVPNLTDLYCFDNHLTYLDLSQVPDLDQLWCYRNRLTELDISKVPNLTWLYCSGNDLTELDLAKVTKLIELQCDHNYLTELDIRNIRNLSGLECDPAVRIIQRPDQNFK